MAQASISFKINPAYKLQMDKIQKEVDWFSKFKIIKHPFVWFFLKKYINIRIKRMKKIKPILLIN